MKYLGFTLFFVSFLTKVDEDRKTDRVGFIPPHMYSYLDDGEALVKD